MVCRQREAEVQEWMESASQSDRGLEEAQAKNTLVGFHFHTETLHQVCVAIANHADFCVSYVERVF